jgi:hypothetical protein
MTWLKLSDDWYRVCRGLSDAAFRTHTEAMAWTMDCETGGAISQRDIPRFAESPHVNEAITELIAMGFWTPIGDDFQLVVGMEYQPEPEVLAKRRELTAERQRKYRRKAVGLTPEDMPSPRDETRYKLRDETRYPGRVGSGRDGVPKSVPRQEEQPRASGENPGVDGGEEPW